MKLCITAQFFGKKKFCLRNLGNGPKMGFLSLKENFVINEIFYLLCSAHSHIWEKPCSCYISQNALSQSDCSRIFKSIIFAEQIDETASFLACWYKFTKCISWSKLFWLVVVKNACGQSGLSTVKLTVCQTWTDGISWFFGCW